MRTPTWAQCYILSLRCSEWKEMHVQLKQKTEKAVLESQAQNMDNIFCKKACAPWQIWVSGCESCAWSPAGVESSYQIRDWFTLETPRGIQFTTQWDRKPAHSWAQDWNPLMYISVLNAKGFKRVWNCRAHLYSWDCDQPSLQSKPQAGALTQPLPIQTLQSTAGYGRTAQSGTQR